MRKTYVAPIGPCEIMGHTVLKHPRRNDEFHLFTEFERRLDMQTPKITRAVFSHTEMKGAFRITIRRRPPGPGVYVGGSLAHFTPCAKWRRFLTYWKWVRFE